MKARLIRNWQRSIGTKRFLLPRRSVIIIWTYGMLFYLLFQNSSRRKIFSLCPHTLSFACWVLWSLRPRIGSGDNLFIHNVLRFERIFQLQKIILAPVLIFISIASFIPALHTISSILCAQELIWLSEWQPCLPQVSDYGFCVSQRLEQIIGFIPSYRVMNEGNSIWCSIFVYLALKGAHFVGWMIITANKMKDLLNVVPAISDDVRQVLYFQQTGRWILLFTLEEYLLDSIISSQSVPVMKSFGFIPRKDGNDWRNGDKKAHALIKMQRI